MTPSIQLLFEGSAEDFTRSVCQEALDHPAVNHPYLDLLAEGKVPDVKAALRDYAFQYSFYSQEFPHYVEAVIGSLEDIKHREALLENLEEEKGTPNSPELKDRPHVEIFNFFKSSVGIDENYISEHQACTTVLVWRDLFLQKCQSRQPGVGVGALGIATEYVVPTIYRKFLTAIKNHTDLKNDDYLFFELHAECDAHHAEDLNSIIEDLATDLDNREAIRFGVFSALNLRKAFWDVLLARTKRHS